MVDRHVGGEGVVVGRDLARLGVDRRGDPPVLLARLEGQRVAGQAVLEDDRDPGQDRARAAVGADGGELHLGPPPLVAVAPDEQLDGDPRRLADEVRGDHADDRHVAADVLVADRDDVDRHLHPGDTPGRSPRPARGRGPGRRRRRPRPAAGPGRTGRPALRASRSGACRSRSAPGAARDRGGSAAGRLRSRRGLAVRRRQNGDVDRRQPAAEPEDADLRAGLAGPAGSASRIVATTWSHRVCPALPRAMLCEVSTR